MVLLSIASISTIASYLQLVSSIPTSGVNSQSQWRYDPTSLSTLKRSNVARANNASCTNGPASRGCWGGGFDINTDSETSWPVTGVTKSYELEITNTTLAPDGTERMVFAVNGQFPGPAIVADWGDTLSITVKNSLQDNGTGIHWHGLQQKKSNHMDGVNGITECPIAPGNSKTYTFIANQYGTTWYHSHHSVQYGDGVVGPIVINGPASANYDIDLGPTTISDWYYLTGTQIDHRMMFGAAPPSADNGLINGTMVSSNGGSYAKTTLQPGKTHLLRLINTSVDNHFKVHLDGHRLKVIQADFVAIEPIEVDWLFISIGQRYDVLITANETVDNYWFRAEVQSGCGKNNNNGNIKSIFSYAGASSSDPASTSTAYTASCDDQTDLVPYVKKNVPSSQFQAHNQNLDILLSTGTNASWSSNNTSVVQWSFDANLMTIDWKTPTLTSVFAGDTSNFTAERNLIELPNANEWTFWIIQAIPGTIGTVPHPIHLHGHDFHVLGSGTGNFTDATGLNYENPTRRDVAMIPANGWLVLAFLTDNPGAWLMHCHIAWHVSEGLAVQFLERASEIPDTFQLGSDYYDNCQAWEDYYDTAVYPQFESGV